MNEPTHLDLFSGIGGFALAAQWAGFRTIGFCEIDKYCQKVLAKNFLADAASNGLNGRHNLGSRSNPLDEKRDAEKNGSQRRGGERRTGEISEARIYGNIFDLDGRQFAGVSLITGGFPCQPFSVAGKRRGAADDRAIWPEMFRVIREARPAWMLGENVPGIIPMELDNVLSDLESIGYATRSFVIPACAVDARHRRDRLWIVANASERRFSGTDGWKIQFKGGAKTKRGGETVSDAAGRSEQRSRTWSDEWGFQNETLQRNGYSCNWQVEPELGRVAHGIPNRVHRLRGLGNAIVPQLAYEILREIRKLI